MLSYDRCAESNPKPVCGGTKRPEFSPQRSMYFHTAIFKTPNFIYFETEPRLSLKWSIKCKCASFPSERGFLFFLKACCMYANILRVVQLKVRMMNTSICSFIMAVTKYTHSLDMNNVRSSCVSTVKHARLQYISVLDVS